MADSDELFETAVDFLTGDTGMPPEVHGDFLAACLKQLYRGQTTIKTKTEDHSYRIIRLETIVKVTGLTGGIGGLIALGKTLGLY